MAPLSPQLFPRCKETPSAGAGAASTASAGPGKKAVTKKKVKKKKKAAGTASSKAAEVRVANIIDLSAPAPEPIVAPSVAVAAFHAARPSAAGARPADAAGGGNIIDLNDPGQCSGFVPPPLQPAITAPRQPPPPSAQTAIVSEATAAEPVADRSTSTSPSPTTPPSSVPSASPPTDEASGKAVQRRRQPQPQTVTQGAQIRETKIEIAGERQTSLEFIWSLVDCMQLEIPNLVGLPLNLETWLRSLSVAISNFAQIRSAPSLYS